MRLSLARVARDFHSHLCYLIPARPVTQGLGPTCRLPSAPASPVWPMTSLAIKQILSQSAGARCLKRRRFRPRFSHGGGKHAGAAELGLSWACADARKHARSWFWSVKLQRGCSKCSRPHCALQRELNKTSGKVVHVQAEDILPTKFVIFGGFQLAVRNTSVTPGNQTATFCCFCCFLSSEALGWGGGVRCFPINRPRLKRRSGSANRGQRFEVSKKHLSLSINPTAEDDEMHQVLCVCFLFFFFACESQLTASLAQEWSPERKTWLSKGDCLFGENFWGLEE